MFGMDWLRNFRESSIPALAGFAVYIGIRVDAEGFYGRALRRWWH